MHATFDKFLEVLRKDLVAVEARVNAGTQPSANGATAADGVQSQNSSQSTESGSPKSKELNDRRTEYGVAWIVYMRFARRAENLKSARAVFGKARRDRWTPWEVFEAAGMIIASDVRSLLETDMCIGVALMEYHCGNKDVTVASRIFERGMELFGDQLEYVLHYLNFLISINDENSE